MATTNNTPNTPATQNNSVSGSNQIIIIPANIQQAAQQADQNSISNYTAQYATQLLIVNDILQNEAQQQNSNAKSI